MGVRYSTVLTLAKHFTPYLYQQILQGGGRGMIPFIMKECKNTQLNGVEVGVHRGTHAYFMLSVLSMQKLFLVDPYLPYVDGDGKEWNVSNEDYAVAQRDLGRFKQCQFIRKTSLDAVADVPEDLDFV